MKHSSKHIDSHFSPVSRHSSSQRRMNSTDVDVDVDVAVHVEAEREPARFHPPVDLVDVRWDGEDLHGNDHSWINERKTSSSSTTPDCLLPSCRATGKGEGEEFLQCEICRGRVHLEHWLEERELLHSVPCRPSFVDVDRLDTTHQAKKHFWNGFASPSDPLFARRCSICRRKGRATDLVQCLHCRRSAHRRCLQANDDDDEDDQLCDFGPFG